jgi:hypothetical protein
VGRGRTVITSRRLVGVAPNWCNRHTKPTTQLFVSPSCGVVLLFHTYSMMLCYLGDASLVSRPPNNGERETWRG